MAIMRVRTEQVQGTSDSYKDFGDQLRVMSESYQEQVEPTNGQTVFTLSRGYTLGYNALKVIINGTLQPKEAYIETDAFTVTISEPLYSTDVVVFRVEGGGSGTTFVSDHAHVYNEKPTGNMDGINKAFAISSAATREIIPSSQQVIVNGLVMAPNDDYTISGNVITLLEAPIAGDKILVNYLYYLRK